ncbi:MAG: hypothetical protein ACAI35_06300 [Candidatus Methylacidiphilales bacterium]|nr:hypothetical protein [Candidatus Methylacidiphilales bacterium]
MTALPLSFVHFGCGTLGALPGVKLNQDLLKKRRKSGRQPSETTLRRAAKPVTQPVILTVPAVRQPASPSYAATR